MFRAIYYSLFQGPVEGPAVSSIPLAEAWAQANVPFGIPWVVIPVAAPVPVVVGKFGKKAAVFDPTTKHFGDLMRKYKLAAPGAWRVDWSRKLDVTKLGTLLNTQLGDCTCASKGHDIQLWTAWTDKQAVISDADIQKMYEVIGGYVPGNPATDQGATILSALQYFKSTGIGGHKLDGYAQVQAGDINEAKAAIWAFGNLDIGLLLPNTCIPQGVWRYVSSYGNGAPGSAGGHDVNVIGYDDHAQLFTVITWGHLKQMSYKFFEVYCDEAYALASQEWLLQANHLTPSDVSWAGLLADLSG